MSRRSPQPLTVWITGYSGSGKTTLIEQLIPHLHPLRVGTAKHHHRMRALDRPGTDTARHQAAGAAATLLAGPAGAALFLPGPRPALRALLAHLAHVDVILIEGFTRQARLAVRLRDADGRLRPLPKACAVAAELQLSPRRRFPVAQVRALAAHLRNMRE